MFRIHVSLNLEYESAEAWALGVHLSPKGRTCAGGGGGFEETPEKGLDPEVREGAPEMDGGEPALEEEIFVEGRSRRV